MADDVALLIAGHAKWENGIVLLEGDAHGVGIENSNVLDHVQVLGEAHAAFTPHLALEAVLDVLGGQLAVALVELHPLPQLEGPHGAVVRHRPAFRQVRLDLRGGHLLPNDLRAVRRHFPDLLDGEASEAAIQQAHAGLRLAENAGVRIEGFLLLIGDLDDFLTRRIGGSKESQQDDALHHQHHEQPKHALVHGVASFFWVA